MLLIFKSVRTALLVSMLFYVPIFSVQVKVLLDEQSAQSRISWHVKTDKSVSCYAGQYHRKCKQQYPNGSLTVSYSGGKWVVNGKTSQAQQIFIVPENGHITLGDKTYHGSLQFIKQQDNIVVINSVSLEDYVYTVLKTESWPGWPLEINKAFAIVSRTYVMSMIETSKKLKRAYHVKNTNVHQTYGGVHTTPVLKQAVQETKGLVLTHNKKPIVAMFDSCCGGVIPARIKGTNFDDAPYLARNYACTHCKRCSIYSWKASYKLKELEEIIKKQLPPLCQLRKIQITKRDKAGLVQELVLHHKFQPITISGSKFYSMLSAVKSFHFVAKMEKDSVHVCGRGYGHHLGLCQWGAREKVRDGWKHEKVLQFYYPKTVLERMC